MVQTRSSTRSKTIHTSSLKNPPPCIDGITWYSSKSVATFPTEDGAGEWFPFYDWRDVIHYARFVKTYNMKFDNASYKIWSGEYMDTDVIPYQFIGDHNEYRENSRIHLRDEWGNVWTIYEHYNLRN